MHCNLRLPVMAAVVLRFNHEVYNTLTYQFSANSDNPWHRYYDLTVLNILIYSSPLHTPRPKTLQALTSRSRDYICPINGNDRSSRRAAIWLLRWHILANKKKLKNDKISEFPISKLFTILDLNGSELWPFFGLRGPMVHQCTKFQLNRARLREAELLRIQLIFLARYVIRGNLLITILKAECTKP